MANIYDIAQKAGVSPATVSRVINGNSNVKEATNEKVLSIMKKLNYRPNQMARGLVLGKTQIIGLVVSNLRHRWATDIVEGLESIACDMSYSVMVCNAADDIRKEKMLLERLMNHHADGVILMPSPDGRLTASMANLVYDSGIPCVALWSLAEEIGTDTVTIDFRKARYEISKHLMELGHRNICVVTGSPAYITSQLHLEGHFDAADEMGVEVSPSLIIHASGSTNSPQVGYKLADMIARLHPKPTAIHAVNDITAISMIARFRELGIRVPEDISVAGFDNIDLSDHFTIPLTTANVPSRQMAIEAGKLLLNRIKNKKLNDFKHIVLKPELVVRSSTACFEKNDE